jgi:ATP-dependent helicase/nuclease subunit B
MAHSHSLSVFASSSARTRLEQAAAALGSTRASRVITIVGDSRGAADDFGRALADRHGSSFGVGRYSLTQYAARIALLTLARRGLTPSSALAAEAFATRAVFDAASAGLLRYFGPVAQTPGFPRALARTLRELRGASLRPDVLATLPLVGADLARLLEHFEGGLVDAHASDRADLFNVASARLADTRPGGTLVLLDVRAEDLAERRFVEAMIDGADEVVATLAPGDDCEALFSGRGAVISRSPPDVRTDLGCLRRYLFAADETPPLREPDGSLELFSAPGEGRECIEIARRVLQEAASGVRFDEMAIVVRSPQSYFGLLEHAFARSEIPVWFDRGTRRPHPAGRAFLALLACAVDRISAVRFAEYLSLAQVPRVTDAAAVWEEPADETNWRTVDQPDDELELEDRATEQENPDLDAPVLAGTLRAPWRWESLIVDARIIAGGSARWRRRLDGYRHELERRRIDASRDDGESGIDSTATLRLATTIRQLEHLQRFALPIIEVLEQWNDVAPWGEWLDRFARLAPRVLHRPEYVLRVVAELRPMASVGPIGLDEAKRVLTERLLTVEAESPARRYGRVFVGTPSQIRGRAFRVVFVPGLAERLFPQKPREDPLLLDTVRETLGPVLPTEARRLRDERQLLQLAVGAASDRIRVSYPRLELGEGRARVPSFYALDLLRATTGRIPSHEALEEHARNAGGAMLAWPAPIDPALAIDTVEHDLAVVRRLLDHPRPDEVKGHAHYLLKGSEHLRRSVVERWRRARPEWSSADGLTRVTPFTDTALASHRLAARSYSLSALQKFAACPYQFVLASMFRLHPLDEPVSLERIDPMTRGSLIHEIQTQVMRVLSRDDSLPITASRLAAATSVLEECIDRVTRQAREDLAPAVDRVWIDDVAVIRRDLHGWLARMTDEQEWVPTYFEFAFGGVPGERDPASSAKPVVLAPGYRLRGAIDLIERHTATDELRVTDYKTGRPPDKLDELVVGGGAVLQPVLYGLVAEQVLGRPVREGRLYYCTSAGNYRSHVMRLDDDGRRAGMEVLEVIDRAIAGGMLSAAPAERACERCDFLAVCGPDVRRRIERKAQAPLMELRELRSRR